MENQEIYTKVKDRDSKMANLWRCVKKKKTCKARCKTDLEDTMKLEDGLIMTTQEKMTEP